MDTSSNLLETTPKLWFLYDWRVWTVLVIVIVAAVLFYVNYTSWTSSPWFSERYHTGKTLWDWLPRWIRNDDLSNNLVSLEQAPSAPFPPQPTQHIQKLTDTKETWCLVAEDLAGRYCVKVPGPQSCTHERSYLSLDQCTLTPGMHLPAGPIQNKGASMELLSSR